MIQREKVVAFADPVASHPNPGRHPPPWPLGSVLFGFSRSRLAPGLPTTTRWKARRHNVLPSEPMVVVQSGGVPELFAGFGPPPEWQPVQPRLEKSPVIVANVVPLAGVTEKVFVVAAVLDAASVTCSRTV